MFMEISAIMGAKKKKKKERKKERKVQSDPEIRIENFGMMNKL
jgi:hypothetical protein